MFFCSKLKQENQRLRADLAERHNSLDTTRAALAASEQALSALQAELDSQGSRERFHGELFQLLHSYSESFQAFRGTLATLSTTLREEKGFAIQAATSSNESQAATEQI